MVKLLTGVKGFGWNSISDEFGSVQEKVDVISNEMMAIGNIFIEIPLGEVTDFLWQVCNKKNENRPFLIFDKTPMQFHNCFY
jgi:hypothetical protein